MINHCYLWINATHGFRAAFGQDLEPVRVKDAEHLFDPLKGEESVWKSQ